MWVLLWFFWWFHPRRIPMGILVTLELRYRCYGLGLQVGFSSVLPMGLGWV